MLKRSLLMTGMALAAAAHAQEPAPAEVTTNAEVAAQAPAAPEQPAPAVAAAPAPVLAAPKTEAKITGFDGDFFAFDLLTDREIATPSATINGKAFEFMPVVKGTDGKFIYRITTGVLFSSDTNIEIKSTDLPNGLVVGVDTGRTAEGWKSYELLVGQRVANPVVSAAPALQMASAQPAVQRAPSYQQTYAPQGMQMQTYSQPAAATQNSAQGIAQQRANYMAQVGRMSHFGGGVFNVGGQTLYEGVGYSTGGTPPTCQGRGAPVADATARGANGALYRVRLYTTPTR